MNLNSTNKSYSKSDRILSLCSKFNNGELIKKKEQAEFFRASTRSIQRDIIDLKNFFERENKSIVYDSKQKGYILNNDNIMKFTKTEVLTVSKILLESRALVKEELNSIIEKLLLCCIPKRNFEIVSQLIANEKFNYIEPLHKTKLIQKIWDIGNAVNKNLKMEIHYTKQGQSNITDRTIRPVGIIFSEFYFYLVAYNDAKDTEFPTIYRIDRIKEFEVLSENFKELYSQRFQEGEFRKRIQFMYGGKLQNITFTYCGTSVEAILDKLPTAEIISSKDGVHTIRAEIFGKGILMWLLSQGTKVELLSPKDLKQELKETISELNKTYDRKVDLDE